MKKQILILFLTVASFSFGQRNVKDSTISTPLIGVHYGGMFTAGDLAKRYGYLNHIGAVISFKTKRNWIYGVEGNFIFGNKIRMKGVLDNFMDSKGNITDVNGEIAVVRLLSRGFNVNAMVGKILPVLSPNKNSGIYVHFGVGYLQHWLRIETQDHFVPSIEKEYKRGYDRMTYGMNFTQFIGYSFMANKGALNFYAGFYASEGLTWNRRTQFFDQPNTKVPQNMRFDMQYGFKLGWYIPIYKRQPKDFYYN